MPLRLTFAPIALGVLALTACGSSESSYSAAATRTCLENAGADVDASGADYVAQEANGGSYLVTINDKILNVSFGTNSDEAKTILETYETFPLGNGELYRDGNAVLVWDDEPGDEGAIVDDCLRAS